MSDNYAISLKRSTALLAALAFVTMLTVVNFASFFSARVSADQLQSRSLTLSSTLPGTVTGNGDPNDETNGSDSTYTFNFTTPSVGHANIGSIQILFCTAAVGLPCTAPTGLDLTGVDLTGAPTGLPGTWTIGTGTANRIDVAAGSAASQTADTAVTIAFDSITNPTNNGTFFARITTFGTTTYTTPVDDGTVASSIDDGITITSRVAETLGFSTKVGDADDPSTNCAPLTGSAAMYLGDPTEHTLSLSATFDNYSLFRLYTNAASGAVVQYEGKTLEKGATDDIDPIGAAAEAVNGANIGTEQFGVAVDGVIGGNATATSTSTTPATYDFTDVDNTADFDGNPGNIEIEPVYANGDGTISSADPEFAFAEDAATTIAFSDSYVTCATAAVRYAANISPLTPAGTYTTKIVYSAVPTY